jgi:hypothetical protein
MRAMMPALAFVLAVAAGLGPALAERNRLAALLARTPVAASAADALAGAKKKLEMK